MSKTVVAGRPHLGVPGNITGSVESGDLPEIITAVGPYKTAHIVGCLHLGELLEGTMDFALLPEYFGGSFDMEYAEKLVVEAFEEDGFEGWGVDMKDRDKDDEGKLGKDRDKEDWERNRIKKLTRAEFMWM
ncbi:hypothetical protein THAOC_34799 [Thalassiosira oceanica]|uniref:Uncharacterized protein n=1 Tax=Thalassiosira oceanica TaxID=159749 RepID=K0R4E8_THAOC|nr:hypothetical protein THAOC_34799 [Thalassiosira oceanica]|eukprot:EJK46529.1 hypothetical protein THAOC_34799 [Thalassiosira oceanica]